MITYEQDPDVLRWGLQLFDGHPLPDCGYCDANAQYNVEDYYQQQYYNEDRYDMGCISLTNSELNEHDIQQLSQLSMAGAPGPCTEEQLQTTYYPQEWVGQSMENYSFGHNYCNEEVDDGRHSSSCSSPERRSYCEEEWAYSLEPTDEYVLDGEVGKRLNQMVPIPHIPKTNGEIPSMDEVTLDHQRLLDRLQLYELVELKVLGDGNCQFRALSDQIYRTPEHHKFVRQQVAKQLKSHPEIYEAYVPMAYGDYLKKMTKGGEWGDHVTLQAAADSYGLKIFVITSFKDTCYIEILPKVQRSNRVISLSFWAEVHYNSIYPEGDMPSLVSTKKKKKRSSQCEHLDLQDDDC